MMKLKFNIDERLDPFLSQIKVKNVNTNAILTELTSAIAKNNLLIKENILSKGDDLHDFSENQVNKFNNTYMDTTLKVKDTNITEDRESMNIVRTNSIVETHMEDWIRKLTDVHKLYITLKELSSSIRDKMELILTEIDIAMTDFGNIIQMSKILFNIVQASIHQNNEMKRLIIDVPNMGGLTKYVDNNVMFTARIVPINFITNSANSKFLLLSSVKNVDRKQSMHLLVNKKKMSNPLESKLVTYKNLRDFIMLIKNEINHLSRALIERIEVTFHIRSVLIEKSKIIRLSQRVRAKNEFSITAERKKKADLFEQKRIETFILYDKGEAHAGYDFKDKILVDALTHKTYPNSMRSLFESLRINHEKEMVIYEMFEITAENFEKNFDNNLATLKNVVATISNTNDPSAQSDGLVISFLKMLNMYVSFLTKQDDSHKRMHFKEDNYDFAKAYDLLENLKVIAGQSPILSQVLPIIYSAQAFEIKTEGLRIKNMGRMTEEEYLFFDKAAANLTLVAPQFNLPLLVNNILQTVNMKKNGMGGKKRGYGELLHDVDIDNRIEQMEKNDDVNILSDFHKVAALYTKKNHDILDDHSIVCKSINVSNLFNEFFSSTLKTEILITEILVRFILENDLGINTLLTDQIKKSIEEVFKTATTFRESESTVFHDILNDIFRKCQLQYQIDNDTSKRVISEFNPIKVKIIQLLKEKEEMKLKLREKLISHFNYDFGSHILAVEFLKNEIEFLNKKLDFTKQDTKYSSVNCYDFYTSIDFIFMLFIYCRLLLWKSYMNEILSRNILPIF